MQARRRLLGVAVCLWALMGLAPIPAHAAVVFNEIMYHPPSGLDGDEFIELFNTGGPTVDLGDACIDGIAFCFPPGTSLAAGQYLMIGSDAAQFQATYGFAPDFTYSLTALDDNGERLALLNSVGTVIDEVTYSDRGEWPVTPDGLGPSLELRNPDFDNSVPQAWFASTDAAGHTAGGLNSVDGDGQLPFTGEVFHSDRPGPTDTIVITTRLFLGQGAVMYYRLDFGPEVQVVMADDGLSGDGAAGDLIYGAQIPAQPIGTLIRFRLEGVNGIGTWYYPRQDDTINYDGTVVVDPALQTSLPVLDWFMDDPDYQAALDHRFTDELEPAVIFFDGELYDASQVRIRGQSARSWPKPPWKFFFPQGHNFTALGLLERPVDNFNLQSNYSDKSFLREILAWETVRESGHPWLQVIPVRVHRNGQFMGLYNLLEAADSDFIRRNGLDDRAPYYKAFSDGRQVPLADLPNFYQKEARLEEGYDDLFHFLTDLNQTTGEPLTNFLRDQIDIPRAVNYIAAKTIFHDNDHLGKNYFFYRDTEGTGRWWPLHWDLDLTFGRNFNQQRLVLNDEIWADLDSLPGEASVAPSHPLFGDSEHRKTNGVWNRFIDRILGDDSIRQMYFRRLRTLMDTLLADGRYEKRIAELSQVLAQEAALDKIEWPEFGTPQTQQQAADTLINQYLIPRRVHLLTTHSVCDIPDRQTPFPRVVINEVMFAHPSGDAFDYVELYNPSPTEAIDLSGWRLDGAALTIPPGTVILPQDYALFVDDDVTFRGAYGGGKFIGGQYNGSLDDLGEALTLRDSTGRVVESVRFEPSAPWPTAASGTGRSLELIDSTQANNRVSNWGVSSGVGGTPGAANDSVGATAALPPVWINEVLPDNGTINSDEQSEFDPWIELYNASSSAVDIGGLVLADNLTGVGGWSIPGGTELCGRCWMLVWADGETADGPLHTDFALNPLAGSVGLFSSSLELIDYINYSGLTTDQSIGRFPDAAADVRPIATITPEQSNTVPSSPIILNEYNAVSDDNFLKNSNSDSFWGRVKGNGGDWFELVVTQDHLDVRGWEVRVTDDVGGADELTTSFVFTQVDRWADLRAGSIITSSDTLPTELDYFPQAGDWTINANVPDLVVSNSNWQLTVIDDLSRVRFGPVGEGINPVSGVGSDEVFKLEEDPSPFIDPQLSNYNDGSSSTFGAPNIYGGGTLVQDFSALRALGLTEPCTSTDSDGDGFCDVEDNCPSDANADQADADGDGQGDACDPCVDDPLNDADGDGLCADVDNCPSIANATQDDGDADGFGDPCDNCPIDGNPSQQDANQNGIGDPCDPCPTDPLPDLDGDGICNSVDNCPDDANAGQQDGDGDGAGDACDPCPADGLDDADLDGVCADLDNCPTVPNMNQLDGDGDGVGDLCDNCPATSNATQTDSNNDGDGDDCDPDDDGDGIPDGSDNCPLTPNPSQADVDMNGNGDACDGDLDGDTIPNALDNCPNDSNLLQEDTDADGFGDACDCSAVPGLSQTPDLVGPSLELDKAAGTVLSWRRALQGPSSNVYRGTFGGSWSYDETCLFAELPITNATDATDPAPGSGFYYLVGGVNTCGAGPIGVDSSGTLIQPASICAATGGDFDVDGVADLQDNCPADANANQLDADADFVGDLCDNCAADANPTQLDSDDDQQGDLCDDDDDDDGALDIVDNCPLLSNADQSDVDADGLGDACDPCTDTDGDGLGDPGFDANTCLRDFFELDPDNDLDGDGIGGGLDNCPDSPNAAQIDEDGDGIGDDCDICPVDAGNDLDGDGICAGPCGALELDFGLSNFNETVLVGDGGAMRYLVNSADPGIGLSWTQSLFR